MSIIVGKYIEASGLGKGGGCHTIRHTAATVMLEAGADTRHIQEFLGHRLLSSTQIYTRVSPTNLKAVHERFHPAAKLGRRLDVESKNEDG